MDKHNVVMILLDGLRADRLNLCPNLLGTLKKGYFFSNMITAAPYTLASMNSIFSGLYPTKNGVDSYFNMEKFKKDVCRTLPQYLNDDGYYTCGDLLRDFLVPSQGFDELSAHDEYKDDLTKRHKEMIHKVAGDNKRFFLFLQYSSLHADNIKNVAKKYDDFSVEYFKNYELNMQRYNSYLKKTDLYVKEIVDYLKNSGLLDNTILIVFSDHGISNGEKMGEKIYGSFTYDYTIRVFCSFIVPDAESREISYQVRTIDIMPTLLEMLNIKPDESYEHLQGKSLIPMMEKKEKEDRIAFSETGGLNGPWPSHHEHNVFCIRLPKWKLIYNKTPGTCELYDLKKDPREKNNIFDKKKKLASELKDILLNHIKLNKKKSI